MKLYDEALGLFHQQKFQRAKQDWKKWSPAPARNSPTARACTSKLPNSA